jgi:hypothetical protein
MSVNENAVMVEVLQGSLMSISKLMLGVQELVAGARLFGSAMVYDAKLNVTWFSITRL